MLVFRVAAPTSTRFRHRVTERCQQRRSPENGAEATASSAWSTKPRRPRVGKEDKLRGDVLYIITSLAARVVTLRQHQATASPDGLDEVADILGIVRSGIRTLDGLLADRVVDPAHRPSLIMLRFRLSLIEFTTIGVISMLGDSDPTDRTRWQARQTAAFNQLFDDDRAAVERFPDG